MVDSNGNRGKGEKLCAVNNGQGGQGRAWYYHSVENFYRMVIPENLGMVQIDLDSNCQACNLHCGQKLSDAKERPRGCESSSPQGSAYLTR